MLLLVLVFLGACTTEEDQEPQVHDSVHDQLSSRSISGLTLTDQNQFRGIESLYLPSTPSSELLESIYHEYEVSEFSTYLDSVFSVSDIRFQWNWTTIDVTNSSDYFVTIPIVNQHQSLKGFLMFYNSSDHSHFDLVAMEDIEFQTNTYTEYEVDDITFVLANKMNELRTLYFGGEINLISQWCRNFVKLQSDRFDSRNFTYSIRWAIAGDMVDYFYRLDVKVECDSFGHRVRPGGGGIPGPDSDWWDIDVWGWDDEDEPINPENNDEDEDEDEETKECEKEFFSPALVALLNSLDALYPCAEDIAEVRRQIKEELCQLAGTNIAFGTGDGSGNGKLGVEDLEQLLATGDFAWEGELDDGYREYVAALKSQNLVNPCNPGEDVVDAALALMEDNGGCGVEDLDAALALTYDEEFSALIAGLKLDDGCGDNFNQSIDDILANGGCDLESFSTAFNDYFGITQSPSDQQVFFPRLQVGDEVCPDAFDINSTGDGIHVSGGISDFRFDVVNIDGEVLTLHHPHIHYKLVEDLSQCPHLTHSQIVADAFNQAVTLVRNTMDSYLSYEDLDPNTETFPQVLDNIIDEFTQGCSNNGSSTGVNPTENIAWYSANCGTQWVDFNVSHINDCE